MKPSPRQRKKSPQSYTKEEIENLSDVEREKLMRALEAKAARLYFNNNTCEAIAEYQKTLDQKTKSVLYTKKIMPAFNKLVENLISINKFVALHDSSDILRNDCVNFLFDTLHKFDVKRGTNAFSYFNVVAKNWLIIKTKQRLTYVRKCVSLDDCDSLNHNDKAMIEENNIIQSHEVIEYNKPKSEKIISLLYEIRTYVKTENELAAVNSIITIFENIEQLDLLNKSAVLLYMRELSGLTQKQLTVAMQSIKKTYKEIKSSESIFDVLAMF